MYRHLSVIVFVLLLAPTSAQAYLGPVLGLGVIGSIIAMVVVGFLSVFSFIYLPIRKLLRRDKADNDSEADSQE